MRRCIACHAEGGPDGLCLVCATPNAVADVEDLSPAADAPARPARPARPVPLARAAARARPPRIALDAPASLAGRLLGGISRTSTVLVHGPGGAGKTTDALAFAAELAAAAGGRVLLVGGEMPAWRYADAARRAGASLELVDIVEAPGGPLPPLEGLDLSAVVAVVYDSANRLDAAHPERIVQAAAALARARGHVAIVVAHVTADGKVKGGTDLAHDCDVQLEIERDAARLVKTREDALTFEIDRRPTRCRAGRSGRPAAPPRPPRRGAPRPG